MALELYYHVGTYLKIKTAKGLNYRKWIANSTDPSISEDDLSSECTHKGYEVVVSNIKMFPRDEIDIQCDSINIDFLKIDMNEEIKLFNKKFQKHIKSMKSFFGKENISIHWGLVTWHS